MYKTSDSNIEYLLSKTWIYKKNKTTNMKSAKKFSAMSAKDQPITESAKVSKEAVEELIKKIGFDSIDELKKEKDLLSELEALSKSFAKKDNISEDELEEDRAEDIEDEVNAKGKPKSAEGEGDDKKGDGNEEAVAAEVEEVEEDTTEDIEDEITVKGKPKSVEVEADLVSDEQEITKDVPEEDDEVSGEDGVPVADEEVETPKATRRIMAFEDFIKEETINKNINYRNDDEEDEDYAVPIAASADPLAESDESKEEEDAEKNESSVIMPFSNFVKEANEGMSEEEWAKSNIVGAKHYLDFEMKEQAIDDRIAESAINSDYKRVYKVLTKRFPDLVDIKDRNQHNWNLIKSFVNDEIDNIEITNSQDIISKFEEYRKNKFRGVVGKLVSRDTNEGMSEDGIEIPLVNEADITSDDQFKEYATAILKKAFGADFDEAKATDVIDGLTSKYSGDYGAMVGALQSSIGESNVAESKVINKTTGKDITKHLLDYMEKKITKEEFEKLTGFTKRYFITG